MVKIQRIITRNLNGDEFVTIAQSDHEIELNGNQILSLSVLPNKTNLPFMNDISPLWEIEFEGNTYKVVYARKVAKGNSFYVDVRAVHKALDFLDSNRTYEKHDGSITAFESFEFIFRDIPYSFVLRDNFYAIDIEGLGDGETKLESFKRLLNRHSAEFYIEGSTFYIQRKVGRESNFMYRYGLNVSNISQEFDGTSYYTYVRGFGDYEESSDISTAKLKDSYEHPLAKLVGRRHAPIVAKGSYKKLETLRKAMEEVVDNSLSISVEVDVVDLRKSRYPFAQPRVGDEVMLIDGRIGFKQLVRIVKITTQKFANGNVRSITVTLGNERLGKSYASKLSSTMSTVNALMKGETKLPFDVLDSRSQDMLRKIMSVDTELTLDNGIFAVDKNDPNLIVGLNSAGWFISEDGGQTANVIATANGIVANYITSGQLDTNLVRVQGTNGLFFIDGDVAKWINASDPDKYVEISSDRGVHVNKGAFSLTGYDGRNIFVDGRMRNHLMANIQIFSKSFDGTDVYTSSGEYSPVYVIRDVYRGNELELSGTARLDGAYSSSTNYLDIAVTRFGLDDPEPYHYVRRKVETTSDPAVYSFRMNINMKSIFGKVVDYERFDWYVKIKLVNENGMTAAFRLNRGEWND